MMTVCYAISYILKLYKIYKSSDPIFVILHNVQINACRSTIEVEQVNFSYERSNNMIAINNLHLGQLVELDTFFASWIDELTIDTDVKNRICNVTISDKVPVIIKHYNMNGSLTFDLGGQLLRIGKYEFSSISII